jgi:hypothetical protein
MISHFEDYHGGVWKCHQSAPTKLRNEPSRFFRLQPPSINVDVDDLLFKLAAFATS